MKRFLSKAAVLLFIIFGFSFSTSSIQPDQAASNATPKILTAKDKAVIIEIFKSINEEDYRMEFNNNELYGKKVLPDSYIQALRTGNLLEDIGDSYLFQTLQPKAGFWYYTNKPKDIGLEKFFGKDNAARFQAIIKKYSGGK